MKSEMVTHKEGRTPAELIQQAVQSGSDLDKVEKLLGLQERWEANEARKAFHDAMSRVHEKMPAVVKSKKNDQTSSKYAELDSVIRDTKKIYTEEGFSISFYEGENAPEGHVRICADVTHRMGYSQSRHYDVPLDGVGIKGNANMTKIHAKASSTTYGRRYLMCMIFNIPTSDDDGNTAVIDPADCITEEQLHQIRDLFAALNVNGEKFINFMKLKSLESMPKSRFKEAMNLLEGKKNRMEAGTK